MRRRPLLLTALATLPCPAFAQTARAWAPPTRMIIGYGAGNITDQVARVLLDVIGQRHGWRTAAENLPGAGGMLGANNLIRAPADGSVCGVVAAAALTILPHIQRNPRFDPFPDLQAVTGLAISSSFLAVNAALPVRSLADLVAYARSRPADSPVFYYSPGNATVPHLNLEALSRGLDFPMQHVPYRTSAAGNTDLLANRVQVTMDSFSITLPHIQSGVLRPLAFNGTERHPLLPEVPTMAEAAPGIQLMNAWMAVFFPKATPATTVDRAAADILDAVRSPAFAEKLPIGTSPFALGPAELADRVRSEGARIGRLIADIGLTPD
ncbi:Bug family tripartite tricarboxylate transporter substrate binding protein [Falsiroseomonas stagni]|uniref:Tripartite-type tricarboxylate transporter, receptor component TctC n=1 Tax=Falsiroseomonas stagni DSM 19981 TaxID=1123062 RepID=A0A1I4EDY2_9PROT|nr:tripartite tricarboxylate transporter substrate binding protein [Falsiroseomonas stagni]SFL03409.1 Tripartite-type tricarboxylate transporter, receptor component TctC [Falsiroseomonas stagni DSM 19981]